MLREHRRQVRVMQKVIDDNELGDDAHAALDGDAFFLLETDSEMDEASDVSDPEQELRAAAADQSAMVQAVQGGGRVPQGAPRPGASPHAAGGCEVWAAAVERDRKAPALKKGALTCTQHMLPGGPKVQGVRCEV